MPYKKKDLLTICIIFLFIIFILILFPTNKIDIYIGKFPALINDKNKSIIVKANYTNRERIKYRIYPFFIKVYIQPVYYGDRIGVYMNEKPILIENNKNYELNKFGTYNTLTIDYILFKKKYNFYILDGKLPLVNINLAKKNVKVDSDTKIPITINIMSDDTSSFILKDNEGVIRERGRNEYKKYNIWFSKAVSIFGLPKRKKLSLVGDIKDAVYFREKVSFDLYGKIDSTKIYPRTVFVELFIDGTYKGVYILEENYDNELFGYKKYDKGQIKPAVIFRCSRHIVFNSKFKAQIDETIKSSKNFYKKFKCYFKQDEPNIKKQDCLHEIWDLVFFILYSSDVEFYDKTNGIYSKIDINSVVDVFLLVQLIRNTDCVSNNLYFSRKEIEKINDKPLFIMNSWDHDKALGSMYREMKKYQKIIGLNDCGIKVNLLFQRLFKNQEIRKRIINRWFELRKDKWSNESILSLLEQYNNEIKCAYNRIDNQYFYENSKKKGYTQQDDINYRIEWIKLRLSWLDDYFNKI